MRMQFAFVACVSVFAASASFAQSTSSSEDTVPLLSLISDIAKRSGKRFVVDPRAQVDVTLIPRKAEPLSYAELLTVLHVHDLAAVEEGAMVRVIPDANIRNLAVPLLDDTAERAEADYVTKVIPVRTTPAAMLVPMLRPLMPVQAHLAASICTNDLVIVDTAANVRRIEGIVRSLDDGEEPYTPRECAPRQSTSDESKKPL